VKEVKEVKEEIGDKNDKVEKIKEELNKVGDITTDGILNISQSMLVLEGANITEINGNSSGTNNASDVIKGDEGSSTNHTPNSENNNTNAGNANPANTSNTTTTANSSNNNNTTGSNKFEDTLCTEKIDYNYCQFDEFFSHELTKCGIVKNNDYVKSLLDNNYLENKMIIETSNIFRESVVVQNEYLHQFVLGNGGEDLESICVLKHGRSLGQLRYGNSIMGVGEAKVSERQFEITLLSIEGDLLYRLTIVKNDEEEEIMGEIRRV